MPRSGSYYYPGLTTANSSYPSVDLKEVSTIPSVADSLGRLYVKAVDGDLYFKDPDGNEIVIASAGSGSSNIIPGDLYVSGTIYAMSTGSDSIVSPNGHLILSSSVGSVVTVSGALHAHDRSYFYGQVDFNSTTSLVSPGSISVATYGYIRPSTAQTVPAAALECRNANYWLMHTYGARNFDHEFANPDHPTLVIYATGSTTTRYSYRDWQSVVAGGSHLILSSSAGSAVHVSGALHLGGSDAAGGEATNPALWLGGTATGLYGSGGTLAFTLSGAHKAHFVSTAFQGGSGGTFAIQFNSYSSTSPHYSIRSNTDTGFGASSEDHPCVIAGGVEVARFSPSGSLQVLSGQLWSEIQSTVTPAATTQTIDWDDGNFAVVDLEDATGDVTLTLSNPKSGASYMIKVIQDSVTPRDLIWPGTCKNPSGVVPVVSAGANAEDLFQLVWDGAAYLVTRAADFS